METVVVGLEDEDLASAAVAWVIERAQSKPISVRLLTALDSLASNPDSARDLVATAMSRIGDNAPGTPIETTIVHGALLHELLVHSRSADLLVIGSRPDARILESRTESFPVSLAARAECPVVIVPDDWEPREGPIVVGVDAEGMSDEAAMFAAREAVEADRELEIVHTWEPWNAPKTRPTQVVHDLELAATVERVRFVYPSVRVHGVLREAVAHDGVIASARSARLVVLGTHRLGQQSGVVLGLIHQQVMLHGRVALCVVPLR